MSRSRCSTQAGAFPARRPPRPNRLRSPLRIAGLDLCRRPSESRAKLGRVSGGRPLPSPKIDLPPGSQTICEVVQAQESVASAHESYIQSLYAHNLAKVELARAIGDAEQGVKRYLKGEHNRLMEPTTQSPPSAPPEPVSESPHHNLLPATERDFRPVPRAHPAPDSASLSSSALSSCWLWILRLSLCHQLRIHR